MAERQLLRHPLRVAVLGCADGKFVLPCARRGHMVYAVDKDVTAILGGWKIGPEGEVWMQGLVSRALDEGLSMHVTALVGDFIALGSLGRVYDLVWTSGAIQYSYNKRHNLNLALESIIEHVAPAGFLYLDYMLPVRPDDVERSHYLQRGAISSVLGMRGWEMVHERVMPLAREAAHVDYPVDHMHRWGHLLARRRI